MWWMIICKNQSLHTIFLTASTVTFNLKKPTSVRNCKRSLLLIILFTRACWVETTWLKLKMSEWLQGVTEHVGFLVSTPEYVLKRHSNPQWQPCFLTTVSHLLKLNADWFLATCSGVDRGLLEEGSHGLHCLINQRWQIWSAYMRLLK